MSVPATIAVPAVMAVLVTMSSIVMRTLGDACTPGVDGPACAPATAVPIPAAWLERGVPLPALRQVAERRIATAAHLVLLVEPLTTRPTRERAGSFPAG